MTALNETLTLPAIGSMTAASLQSAIESFVGIPGAVVTITGFTIAATMSLDGVSLSDWSLHSVTLTLSFTTGLALDLGVSANNINVTGVTASRRHLLSGGLAIGYSISGLGSDPAAASSVVSRLSSPSNGHLLSSLQAGGLTGCTGTATSTPTTTAQFSIVVLSTSASALNNTLQNSTGLPASFVALVVQVQDTSGVSSDHLVLPTSRAAHPGYTSSSEAGSPPPGLSGTVSSVESAASPPPSSALSAEVVAYSIAGASVVLVLAVALSRLRSRSVGAEVADEHDWRTFKNAEEDAPLPKKKSSPKTRAAESAGNETGAWPELYSVKTAH